MKNIIVVLILIFSFQQVIAQNELVNQSVYKIGDVLPPNTEFDYIFDNGSKLSKELKLSSKLFSKIKYYATSDNVITAFRFIVKDKKYVTDFLDRNCSLVNEVSSQYVESKNYSCPIFRYDLDLKRKELTVFNLQNKPFEKVEDKFKKTLRYISYRNSIFNINRDPSRYVEFKYFFMENSSNIYCELNLRLSDWLFAKQVSFLLDNGTVIDKPLIEQSREVSDYDASIVEDYIYILSPSEAELLSTNNKIQIRITGNTKKFELPMNESSQYAIKDIINSPIFNSN